MKDYVFTISYWTKDLFWSVIASLLMVCSCIVYADAAPLVGVHFNQFLPTDPIPTGIDVAFIQTNNSPSGIDWQALVKKSGASKVILNAEGIDRNQLLTGWGDPSKATILNERKAYPWHVDASFVYYEFPVYTMPNYDSNLAYSMLKMPIYLLYRTYDENSLATTLYNEPKGRVQGGFFELDPHDLNHVKALNVGGFIDSLAAHGRVPVLLIPPGEPGPYVHNVINALLYIKSTTKNFDKCTVLFAVYNRNYTMIDFKRIQSAVTVFKGNFK